METLKCTYVTQQEENPLILFILSVKLRKEWRNKKLSRCCFDPQPYLGSHSECNLTQASSSRL